MQKSGYPNILPDLDKENQSIKISINLDKAKKEYKAMDKNNILVIYPVLKQLFFCYTDYISYSTNHLIRMKEGDLLPGTVNELKSLLKRLNTWPSDNID